MAKNEKIVIEIDLDTSNIKRAYGEVEEEAKKTGEKIQKDNQKSFEDSQVKRLQLSVGNLNEAMDVLANKTGEATAKNDLFNRILNSSTAVSLGVAAAFGTLTDQISAVFGGFANSILGTKAGVIGLATNFQAAQALIEGFADALKGSEDALLRSIGKFLELSGIVTGILSGGLVLLIKRVGEVSFAIGSTLVDAFDSAAASFIKFDSELRVFNETVRSFNRDSEQSTLIVKDWNIELGILSKALNVSQTELQKAGAEIVAVGKKIGLTTKQQQQLLKISTAYAKVTGKDVFQSAVNFVSALAGQTQSVIAYGVKLNEATISQELLSRGSDKTFRQLSEGAKVQERFTSLLDQYTKVASVAGTRVDSLAEAGNKLAVVQERLSIAFGRGAAVIEQNNILTAAYAATLNLLGENLLATVGFLGALGARVLQVGGLILAFSFQITAATKAFQLLDLFLQKRSGFNVLTKTIPFINKSLNELFFNLTGVTLRLNSGKQAVSALRLVFTSTFKAIPSIIAQASKQLILFLLPLTPIIAKIALLAAAFQFVITVFRELEERTQVFSDVFRILVDEFNRSDGILSGFKRQIETIAGILKDVLGIAIGSVVFSLSKFISALLTLAQKNPFGVFSKTTVKSLGEVDKRLKELNKELQLVDFNINRLSGKGTPSPDDPILPDFNLEELRNLQKELQNVGKTDIQLLQEQYSQRLTLIQNALLNEAITQKEAADLQLKALRDFNEKQAAIQRNSPIGQAVTSTIKTIEQVTVQGIASIGASLVTGGKAFEDFGKFVLGIIGDLLIQIGTAVLGIGKAIEAVRASLTTFFGGFSIVAGLALIALGGVLKSLGSGGLGVAGGGTTIGSGGAPADEGVIVGADAEDVDEKVTKVSIDVSGQVLNPLEVGNRLAEVLNEAFEAGGTRVITA